MKPPLTIVKILSKLSTLILILNHIRATETDNYNNLCKGAKTLASDGSSGNAAVDGKLYLDCYPSDKCTHIQGDTDLGISATFTVDLGEPMQISTILFLLKDIHNTDDTQVTHYYGTDPDPWSPTNIEIKQADYGKTPSMIADLNYNGPATLQFIHVVGFTDFSVAEIACYEKRRLYPSEIAA